MLDALASERKRLKRTNKPIIFVAYSLGGILVKRALLLQGNSSSEKDDYWRSIRERTYGVISVGSTRRGQFPKTLSLAAGQLASYTVLRNYENCHGAAFTNHQSPVQPRWLSKQVCFPTPSKMRTLSFELISISQQSLDEFLKVLQTPPTTPFVLVALAYGVSATLQYHINRADRLQQLFLIIGLALGAWKTLPFFTNPDQEPRLVSALSLSVTISMLCSACGHWIWRTLCRKPAVIDLMLEEWVLDASTSTNESRGIRFHEIG